MVRPPLIDRRRSFVMCTEIHRAWVTVDNVIYIWDYLTEQNVCIIDALEQVRPYTTRSG